MKDKIFITSFLILLFGFMISSIIQPDKSISFTERRKLSSFPEWEGSFKVDYFSDLDKYLIDQFPLRDELRKLKAYSQFYLFQKKDNNNIAIEDGKVLELNYKIDDASLTNFTKKMNEVKEKYLTDQQIYYSIIPDKNYYFQNNTYPKMDYLSFQKKVEAGLNPSFQNINLWDCLSLEDYYDTDIHWRQEKLSPVVERLLSGMHTEDGSAPKVQKSYSPFYGALYGKSALPLKGDNLVYLTNEILDKVTVYDYETKKEIPLYQEKHLQNVDAYDIYLSGARALLELRNESAISDKELVIFRDSFTSSLAPLLIESYKTITLVDMRYMGASYLQDKVNFTGKDILFLYSVPVINNSYTLK